MAKSDKRDYVCGDQGEGGFEIKQIIGFTPHFIVYIGKGGDLRFEVDDEHAPDFLPPCIPIYDNLQTLLHNSISSKKIRASLNKSLGRALYSAVRSGTCEEAKKCFNGIAKRIANEMVLHARVCYITSSIFFAAVIWTLSLTYYRVSFLSSFSHYFLGACAGVGGAVISVLLRSSKIEVPHFSTPFEHLFQGLSRVLLGCLCGIAIVVLSKAELALGLAKENAQSILAFGILAGFSERYLPNILQRMDPETEPDEEPEVSN